MYVLQICNLEQILTEISVCVCVIRIKAVLLHRALGRLFFRVLVACVMTPYELAYEYVMHTNRSVFLTGKAGTGKTTMLRRLKQDCPKQMMVVAPTGVAAINAEGVTIHSLFQLPPQLFLPVPAERHKLFAEMQMRKPKQHLLANMELLVIDEISMVRADLLDTIDAVLRHVKHRPALPFGGAQLLLIGDLYQLSPVAREEEWVYLRDYYTGPYFFQSQVFPQIKPVYIELDHIFRQTNLQFVDLLNEVRNNCLSEASLSLLNSRYQPDWQPKKGAPFHIVLSTHNRKVDAINQRELEKLHAESYTFHANITGNFPESQFPIEETLVLKRGARVMFVRTDSSQDKLYYNGKLGVVAEVDGDKIVVECEGQDGEKEYIDVHSETWENIRYTSEPNSDEIQTEIVGTFEHIPLRLAWAVTIHKAQGLTFDRVVIDAADAFAAGQVYVALSRCRTLEGIVLLSPIPSAALSNAREVLDFTAAQPQLGEVETNLSASQRAYFIQVLCGLYDFREEYRIVEGLVRLVDTATSFNQTDTLDYLRRIGQVLQDRQHTAEVFQHQLRIILNQEEIDRAYLVSRLQAATGYYAERIDTLLRVLQASPAYSDDKKDAREYEERMTELFVSLARRGHVMQAMAKRPSVETYFAARKAFVMPKVHISAQGEQAASETQHEVLMKRLKALRFVIAKELNAEDTLYRVFSTKTLVEICNRLPKTKKELLAVPGIGKKRYALFGDKVLYTVKKYMAEQKEESAE